MPRRDAYESAREKVRRWYRGLPRWAEFMVVGALPVILVYFFFFFFTVAENSWKAALLVTLDQLSPFKLSADWASVILSVLGYLFVPAFIGAVVSFYVTSRVRRFTDEELQQKMQAILTEEPREPPDPSRPVETP